MKRPTRIYLLGPMTGYFNDNRHVFRLATQHLRALGFDVLSPEELDESDPVEDPTWEKLMARDLPYLLTCEAGAALPGWRQSDGGSWEALCLAKLKRPIFELSCPTHHAYTLADMELVEDEDLPRITHPVSLPRKHAAT